MVMKNMVMKNNLLNVRRINQTPNLKAGLWTGPTVREKWYQTWNYFVCFAMTHLIFIDAWKWYIKPHLICLCFKAPFTHGWQLRLLSDDKMARSFDDLSKSTQRLPRSLNDLSMIVQWSPRSPRPRQSSDSVQNNLSLIAKGSNFSRNTQGMLKER